MNEMFTDITLAKLAILCQTNGIYIQLNGKYVYIKNATECKQYKEF